MNRRTFVLSCLSLPLAGAAAGCLDGDSEDDEEEFEPGNGNSRRVLVESDRLLRRGDSLIRQSGSVFVTIRLENAGLESVAAEVTLQMRDQDGGALGSPMTQRRGPIAPGRSVQIRFDTDLDPEAVGGYALTVTEGDDADGNGSGDADAGDNSSADGSDET